MSDIKLYSLASAGVNEISGAPMQREKDLQRLCQMNLPKLFGVRLVQSEFRLGRSRIDTVALGAKNCPVILEYKRRVDEKVIAQSLSYMTDLHNRKDSLWKAVSLKYGQQSANALDWPNSSIICVAAEFSERSRNSVVAVKWKMQLYQYRMFGKKAMMLEHLNAPAKQAKPKRDNEMSEPDISTDDVYSKYLARVDKDTKQRFEKLASFLGSLGDDVQRVANKQYLAYRRDDNIFACLHPQVHAVKAWVRREQSKIALDGGFVRDVSNVGHYGVGDTEITIKSDSDMERAKPLLRRAYEEA